MIIEVCGLVEGKSYSFDYEITGIEELFKERGVRFLSFVRAFGEYILTNGNFKVLAKIEARVEIPCDRCLKGTETDINARIDETFVNLRLAESFAGGDFLGTGSSRGFERSFDGKSLELNDVFREVFVLTFPEYVLCHKDCLGLCSSCGKDQNNFICDCNKKDDESNPFGKLLEFASGGNKNGGTKKKNV